MNTKLKGRVVKFQDQDFRTAAGCNPPHPTLDCVAVAMKDGVVAVRSTHDNRKATTLFDYEEWGYFLQGVKNGQFELPA